MLVRLLVNALALLLVFFLVWGVHGGNDVIATALVLSVVLALINAFIRPVVILLTLPISIVTLGLFVLLVNALLFWFAVNLAFSPLHIHIDFWRAVLGYLVFVIVSGALNHLTMYEA
jgi:putative membrane protein